MDNARSLHGRQYTGQHDLVEVGQYFDLACHVFLWGGLWDQSLTADLVNLVVKRACAQALNSTSQPPFNNFHPQSNPQQQSLTLSLKTDADTLVRCSTANSMLLTRSAATCTAPASSSSPSSIASESQGGGGCRVPPGETVPG